VVAGLGLATALLPPYADPGAEQWLMLGAFAITVGVFAASFRRPRRSWVDTLAPLLFFVVIVLARDATGGATSGLGVLVMLPLLWLAMTGTPRGLLLAAGLTLGVFLGPIVLVGGAAYPDANWRPALLWVAFAVLVAPVVQGLVQALARGGRALAISEARWRGLAEHLPEATVLVVDEELVVRQIAGAGAVRQGLSGAEGRPLSDLSRSENMAVLVPLIEDAFAGREGTAEVLATATGTEHEITVTPLPDDADGRRALILARDVGAEREREKALLQANRRTERLFADAPHGVAVLDTAGSIVRVNAALSELLGRAPGDLVGRHLSALSAPGDVSLTQHLDQVLANHPWPVETNGTVRDIHGRLIPVVLTGRALPDGVDDKDDMVLVNIVDASERRRYEERLAHIADHDVLTGLANRRRFDVELQRHLDRCSRYGPTGAVLLLDLDNFKRVNDTLGHRAGDDLLVSVAELLLEGVRRTDLIARLGGDEFAVLLTEGDQSAAESVARSLVDLIRDYTATLDGVRRRVSVSIGVVTFRAATEHTNDVLALADMTMYDAKEAGRNQFAILQEGEARPPRSGARLEWQDRIEEALEHDRFELLLQPILDLHTDRVTSAEVLLRLRHEEDLVGPGRFLYIAERSGQMPRVDAWVIERSAALLARLGTAIPGFELAVNLSGHSIGDPRIEEVIVAALHRNDVDPRSLTLEITETAAVADVRLAREFAERMTALGCKFALDDFGAGFGSFYYLKHLLFDYVKIDGEFVSGAHRSVVDRTIVSSIVGIARNLGKRTIAEFVSDPEILAVMRQERVDMAQGYLIGEPMPYEEFVGRYAAQTRANVQN
jgi:diguanylate cyclase (GGDEF)-like protein/PAS domain S-box-containing protein